MQTTRTMNTGQCDMHRASAMGTRNRARGHRKAKARRFKLFSRVWTLVHSLGSASVQALSSSIGHSFALSRRCYSVTGERVSTLECVRGWCIYQDVVPYRFPYVKGEHSAAQRNTFPDARYLATTQAVFLTFSLRATGILITQIDLCSTSFANGI